MDLTKIISISGMPGLYKLVAQAKGGFIVEDLEKEEKQLFQLRKMLAYWKMLPFTE